MWTTTRARVPTREHLKTLADRCARPEGCRKEGSTATERRPGILPRAIRGSPAAGFPEGLGDVLTRRRFLKNASLSSLGVVVSGRASAVTADLPGIRRVRLDLPDLPLPWDGLRIAQVSDVHAGPYMPEARMRRVRDLVASLDADLVVFTGDQMDRRPGDAASFAAGFAGVNAPLGVYGILGNHDHLVGAELATQALAEAGIRPLVNDVATFRRGGAPLALVGVDDITAGPAETGGGARFELIRQHPNAFRICLCHQPLGWPQAHRWGAHVTLAGHTHGGQIALTTRTLNVARLHTRWIAGPYRREDSFLYVSRGIGVGAVPLRVGAPPEIDLITLRRPAAVAIRNAA